MEEICYNKNIINCLDRNIKILLPKKELIFPVSGINIQMIYSDHETKLYSDVLFCDSNKGKIGVVPIFHRNVEIRNLPEENPGHLYIVPEFFDKYTGSRRDLIHPADAVLDPFGCITGYRGFKFIHDYYRFT